MHVGGRGLERSAKKSLGKGLASSWMRSKNNTGPKSCQID